MAVEMAKELMNMQMDRDMKEILKTIAKLGLGSMCTRMVTIMKENGKMICIMDLEHSATEMDQDIKANGALMKRIEKEFSLTLKVRDGSKCGRKELRFHSIS